VRVPLARRRGAEVVPALVAGALAVIDLLYVAASPLDGLIHLLLFLLVYRLYTRTTLRDVRDVAFISFFMLVAAAPGTFDVGFLFVFLTFLLAGIAMLIVRHLLVEAELALPDPQGFAVVPRHVLVLTVVASVATLAITAVLFFVIPRIGQAALPLRAKMGRMVSGFSDRVNLGAFGEIETDGAVAMRVHRQKAIRRSSGSVGCAGAVSPSTTSMATPGDATRASDAACGDAPGGSTWPGPAGTARSSRRRSISSRWARTCCSAPRAC
jgi:hypothetical protein